jgi:DnaK suppressor protein
MKDFSKQYNQLKEEQKRLTHELDQLNNEQRSSEENREGNLFGKREEEATEVFELEKRLAVEHQTNDMLASVNHALQKYDAGTYGICDECGKSIEPARLEALPYANLCLTCKANLAKKTRGAG